MSKTLSLLALFFLVGCMPTNMGDFAWDHDTRPVGVLEGGISDPTWEAMVSAGVAKWSVPLVQMGCVDPFAGTHGHTQPVNLIPADHWVDGGGLIGQTHHSSIDIMGTVDKMEINQAYQTVLPHELGHALNLDHSESEDSVMHTPALVTEPSMTDLQNAAKAIGCLDVE